MVFIKIFGQVERDLNPYALDYPTCVEDSPRKYGRTQRNWLMRHVMADMSNNMKKAIGLDAGDTYEPCADDYMTRCY